MSEVKNSSTEHSRSIPEGWVETTLGDVMRISSGKARPKTFGKYPVYGGNGILDYASEFNFDNETIIVGRVGAYCGCVYYENGKFWLSDNALGIKSNEKSDIKFLYYYLIFLRFSFFLLYNHNTFYIFDLSWYSPTIYFLYLSLIFHL